jgi:hypothetical protein
MPPFYFRLNQLGGVIERLTREIEQREEEETSFLRADINSVVESSVLLIVIRQRPEGIYKILFITLIDNDGRFRSIKIKYVR